MDKRKAAETGRAGLVEFELVRSSRRTLAIQVSADGAVTVRAPWQCSRARAKAFVEEKQDWILRKQEEMRSRSREKERKKGQLPEWGAEDYKRGRAQAAQVFAQRTAYFAGRMGVSYGRITIRDQKTRWGSCSAKGNLNFNWRLVLAPQKVLDYVVVHELAHRKEMNHSPRFWKLVEEEMPDYLQQKRWLKENGELLMAR